VWSKSLTIFPQAFSEKANINNYQRRNYQTAWHGYSWRKSNQVRSEIEGEQQNETGHGFREVSRSGNSNDLLREILLFGRANLLSSVTVRIVGNRWT
jgi:hypothetical protein